MSEQLLGETLCEIKTEGEQDRHLQRVNKNKGNVDVIFKAVLHCGCFGRNV